MGSLHVLLLVGAGLEPVDGLVVGDGLESVDGLEPVDGLFVGDGLEPVDCIMQVNKRRNESIKCNGITCK